MASQFVVHRLQEAPCWRHTRRCFAPELRAAELRQLSAWEAEAEQLFATELVRVRARARVRVRAGRGLEARQLLDLAQTLTLTLRNPDPNPNPNPNPNQGAPTPRLRSE